VGTPLEAQAKLLPRNGNESTKCTLRVLRGEYACPPRLPRWALIAGEENGTEITPSRSSGAKASRPRSSRSNLSPTRRRCFSHAQAASSRRGRPCPTNLWRLSSKRGDDAANDDRSLSGRVVAIRRLVLSTNRRVLLAERRGLSAKRHVQSVKCPFSFPKQLLPLVTRRVVLAKSLLPLVTRLFVLGKRRFRLAVGRVLSSTPHFS
jgi:hypothetical protein